MKCKKHNLKNDYVFFINDGCNDRMICKKCLNLDKRHQDHKYICIEYFINDEID